MARSQSPRKLRGSSRRENHSRSSCDGIPQRMRTESPVTSRPRLSEYDLPIQDWKLAGLNVPSCIRVHKLTVLPKSGIVRQLGGLTTPDRDALVQILARARQN